MRTIILFAIVIALCASGATSAQTRRISQASHSGTGIATDDDNFGLSPSMERRLRAADSAKRAADSPATKRPKSRSKQKSSRPSGHSKY